MLKCFLSFILGGLVGIILMSCVIISKEGKDEKSKKDK